MVASPFNKSFSYDEYLFCLILQELISFLRQCDETVTLGLFR